MCWVNLKISHLFSSSLKKSNLHYNYKHLQEASCLKFKATLKHCFLFLLLLCLTFICSFETLSPPSGGSQKYFSWLTQCLNQLEMVNSSLYGAGPLALIQFKHKSDVIYCIHITLIQKVSSKLFWSFVEGFSCSSRQWFYQSFFRFFLIKDWVTLFVLRQTSFHLNKKLFHKNIVVKRDKDIAATKSFFFQSDHQRASFPQKCSHIRSSTKYTDQLPLFSVQTVCTLLDPL